MRLLRKTYTANIYEQDSLQINYNFNTGFVRFRTIDGTETRRKKPDDVNEINFVQSIFDVELGRRKQVGLAKIFDMFDESRAGKISARTIHTDKTIQNQLLHLYAGTDFSKATAKEVRAVIDSSGYSNDKKNRFKKKMQQVVDFAIGEDVFPVTYNVFKAVKMWTVPKSDRKAKLFFESPTDVPPEHHTINRLYSVATTPQQRCLILLCTITGARINEIQMLTWDDVIVKDNANPVLRIQNSKIKPSDTQMDKYRYMDITPANLQKLYELKQAMIDNETDLNPLYGNNVTAPAGSRDCDRRPEMKWKYILSGLDGYKTAYTTLRRWYARMWEAAYDKYIDHKEYPFAHARSTAGLTFHAFRRHYVCSFRESIPNFTLENHEQLQQLIGHTVGSKVTDSIYTQWKASKVTDAKMNHKINLGVNF